MGRVKMEKFGIRPFKKENRHSNLIPPFLRTLISFGASDFKKCSATTLMFSIDESYFFHSLFSSILGAALLPREDSFLTLSGASAFVHLGTSSSSFTNREKKYFPCIFDRDIHND